MIKFKVFNFPDGSPYYENWALPEFTKKINTFLDKYKILDVQLSHNTERVDSGFLSSGDTTIYISYLIKYEEK